MSDSNSENFGSEVGEEMVLTGNPSELVSNLVGQIMNAAEEASVLGNFVFIGEIIDTEGIPRLIFVTSDNLPEWVARGMIATAEDMFYDGMMDD